MARKRSKTIAKKQSRKRSITPDNVLAETQMRRSARTRVRKVRDQVLPSLRNTRDHLSGILLVWASREPKSLKNNLYCLHERVQEDITATERLFKMHEDEERKIEGKSNVWTYAETFTKNILSFIPMFKDGINRQGSTAAQNCASTIVILGLTFTAFLAFAFSAVECVCLFSGAENCETVALHKRLLASIKKNECNPSVAEGTTPGALGYHGPFGDAVLTAMPYKPVARGFWTDELPRGPDGARKFCSAVVGTLEDGQNSRSIPIVHMDPSMNCKTCIQQHNAPHTPQSIMTCLAPLHFRGYDIP